MEGLHWDSLSSCVQPRVWRHHLQEHKETPKPLNVDVVDILFNSDQGNKSCRFASESGRASGVIQPALDSINGGSSLNLLHRQQATVAGAGWQGGLTADLHTPLINRLYSSSPLSSLMPVGNPHAASTGLEAADTLGLSGDSLESLDCLLSTTNSNTDTSVEDDGISMLFSDCRNLWNFTSGSTISSGDSKKNNGVIKDACREVSNHHPNSSNMRPSCSKRNKVPEPPNHYFDIFQSDSSTTEGGFQLITENHPLKKPRLEQTSNINFQQPNNNNSSVSSTVDEPDTEAIAQVKEMIYRAAVFRPVSLDLEVVERPKRKNVRISSDPQTVAARQRRERISERIRILQRLVPGGNKMDTASMLDEAANYLKFLRSQVKALETLGYTKFDSVTTTSTSTINNTAHLFPSLPFNQNCPMQTFFPFTKP